MDRLLINPLTVRPQELKPGDVMAVTVTLHVCHRMVDNKLTYRIYRCPYPPGESLVDGVPQGQRIQDEDEVAQALFPVVIWGGLTPDW